MLYASLVVRHFAKVISKQIPVMHDIIGKVQSGSTE